MPSDQLNENILIKAGVDDFSFRIINPEEVKNLTDDALLHLLDLKENFHMTEECFENILADISSIFGILDLECLKNLLDYRGVGKQKIIN